MHDETRAALETFVKGQNARKHLFTAGPASLLVENLSSLSPCFGRGDQENQEVEDRVMASLRLISGHEYLIRLQGSATLALEIAIQNFIEGRVVVVNSGYYSDRLLCMAAKCSGSAQSKLDVHELKIDQIGTVDGKADWVVACYTETSAGLKLPIQDLRRLADRLGAKLMLDATASIGLEQGHELADVVAYSSCKGLFGLTGAAFIASHELPSVEVDSFYLGYYTHREKRVTGPYHAILSLADVLPRLNEIRQSVLVNKQRCLEIMKDYLCVPESWQPQLCTRVTRTVHARTAKSILYASRLKQEGSIICHLGEAHLGAEATGAILEELELQP